MTDEPLSLSLRRIARVKMEGRWSLEPSASRAVKETRNCSDEQDDGKWRGDIQRRSSAEVYRQPFPTGHPTVYFPIPPANL